MSRVGGFWTALNSITFFIMSYYLYHKFIKEQADAIKKDRVLNFRGDSADRSADVMGIIKNRFSLLSIFELFDRHNSLKSQVQDM